MKFEIDNLSVGYHTDDGIVRAVDDVSFEIEEGERFGLVGESGCGKTTVAKSIIGLLDDNGEVLGGEIRVAKKDETLNLVEAKPDKLRDVRWADISLVSQSAMNALDPVYTIGNQIREAIQHHRDVSDEAALNRARDLLDQVGINKERVSSYPHQLSGGMRQRAMIAMAMALEPGLILADEPTTALDVITQDHILARIDELSQELGNSQLMITHDISVVAETCDRVGVMYAGELVEVGPLEEVFVNPEHPYTKGLLNAFPSLDDESELITITGEPPQLTSPPEACRFAPRCPYSEPECERNRPELTERGENHRTRCFVTEDGTDLDEEYETVMEVSDNWKKL
jgi:oligopeptide/dipeptide ABC transporter ATP-binding protein